MSDSPVYQLFVYGSLRSGFKSHAYEYISRYFRFVGDAKVKGQLYDLGIYPAGIPSTDEKYIFGELYRIKDPLEFAWAIGQLDDYEGVSVEPDEIQLYQRAVTDVFIGDSVEKAWIYWYYGDITGRPLIESGDLLEYIKNK